MIAEQINEASSKLQSNFNQSGYIGFGDNNIPLHHFYRTLDVLSKEENLIPKYLKATSIIN